MFMRSHYNVCIVLLILGVILHSRQAPWATYETDAGGDALGLCLQGEADADEEENDASEQEPQISFGQHPDQAESLQSQYLCGATLSFLLQQERVANASAHGGGSPVADDGTEDCGFLGQSLAKGKRMKSRKEAHHTSPSWALLRWRLQQLEEEQSSSSDSDSSKSEILPAANIIHGSTLTPAEMTEVQLDGPGSAFAVSGRDAWGDTDAD
ncbi:unnamed protein product [Polarella glacialis]|uniref:Uncharacterized protein n=1 Tax=Polarella glacialis TaxID=89957 RepID=A0A813E7J3_POLGL|nr:unnamed protein product [Polarella glacialis]